METGGEGDSGDSRARAASNHSDKGSVSLRVPGPFHLPHAPDVFLCPFSFAICLNQTPPGSHSPLLSPNCALPALTSFKRTADGSTLIPQPPENSVGKIIGPIIIIR